MLNSLPHGHKPDHLLPATRPASSSPTDRGLDRVLSVRARCRLGSFDDPTDDILSSASSVIQASRFGLAPRPIFLTADRTDPVSPDFRNHSIKSTILEEHPMIEIILDSPIRGQFSSLGFYNVCPV